MSIKLEYPSTCPNCRGDGYIGGTHTKCNICNGWGDLSVRESVENRNRVDADLVYRLELKHTLKKEGIAYDRNASIQELEELMNLNAPSV